MDAQLRELIPFLRDKNPQVRQLALSNLLPQTAKGSPHRNIFFEGLQGGGLKQPKESNLLRDLKLLCRDQLSVAHDAFRALVNLTDSALLVPSLSEPSFLEFLVAYIIHPQSILADLASMLLSNLSSSSTACSALLSVKTEVIINPKLPNGFYATQSRSGTCSAPVPYPTGETRTVPALFFLVDAFAQGAHVNSADLENRARKGDLHFLASVFANLTVSPAGRDFFLTPCTNPIDANAAKEYPLAKLVPFTEHSDIIRRGGIASAFKNCCFNSKTHQAMLTPSSEKIAIPPSTVAAPGIDILPALLLPLAGPEELDLEDQEKLLEPLQFLPPDKKREQDIVIRLMHVESLLLLCHTRWGRDYQRQHGVYEIVKATHENESVDKISEQIERLVMLIKGEEPKDSLDVDVDEQANKTNTIADDDEDNKIEEI